MLAGLSLLQDFDFDDASEKTLNVLLKKIFDPSVVELDFDSLQIDDDEMDFTNGIGLDLPAGFEMEEQILRDVIGSTQ